MLLLRLRRRRQRVRIGQKLLSFSSASYLIDYVHQVFPKKNGFWCWRGNLVLGGSRTRKVINVGKERQRLGLDSGDGEAGVGGGQ